MTAGKIARALGGAYRTGAWWRCHCPAHGSASASLALRDGDRGLIVHCWAGCQAPEVLAELGHRGLLDANAGDVIRPPDPAAARRRREAEVADRRRRLDLARDIWTSSWPADATSQIGRYFASRRIAVSAPPSIRLHGMFGPYGKHPGGQCRPQMVGLVEHVEHGAVGVHRTFLALDGSQKAVLDPVRICHGPIAGGAVRLAPAAETLMVGEGIETCLAAMQATAMPSWAALSTSGLVALVLPSIVRTVVILADNDANGAGERAAHAAAQRCLAEGRRVRIAIPHEPGTDMADVLADGEVSHVAA